MYTDVVTPNLQNVRVLSDNDYIHVLRTRGDYVKRDHRVITKTPEEKKVAKAIVNQHRALLRSHGYSHKKRLNLSDPMTSNMRF